MRIVASVLAATAIGLVAVAGATPETPATVLGVVTGNGTQTLTRLDAVTLQPTVDRAAPIPATVGRGLRSPDRSRLVLASNSAPVLTLVDVDRMEVLGTMTPATAGTVQLIAWPEERRLYALGWGCCPVRTDVLVIDPVERTVVARVPLKGTDVSEAALTDGVAILTAPLKGIGTARVVAVGRDGSVRRVALPRIRAGSKWRTVDFQPVGSIRWPGFTADAGGGHAYVVDPSGLVADVEIASLHVAYRASRAFARAEKQVTGPMRHAQWIGDGRIAVSGTNAQRRKTRTGWVDVWAPAGLTIVDTRAWTSQVVDTAASWFARSADAILVVAAGHLAAYGPDGRVRYRLPVASRQAYVEVHAGYAYLWDETTVTVLAAASGTVLAKLPKPQLWLVGDP